MHAEGRADRWECGWVFSHCARFHVAWRAQSGPSVAPSGGAGLWQSGAVERSNLVSTSFAPPRSAPERPAGSGAPAVGTRWTEPRRVGVLLSVAALFTVVATLLFLRKTHPNVVVQATSHAVVFVPSHDLDLVAEVAAAVEVPVVASGGAGDLSHLGSAVAAGASAVLVASLLHDSVTTVGALKLALWAEGVEVRP